MFTLIDSLPKLHKATLNEEMKQKLRICVKRLDLLNTWECRKAIYHIKQLYFEKGSKADGFLAYYWAQKKKKQQKFLSIQSDYEQQLTYKKTCLQKIFLQIVLIWQALLK